MTLRIPAGADAADWIVQDPVSGIHYILTKIAHKVVHGLNGGIGSGPSVPAVVFSPHVPRGREARRHGVGRGLPARELDVDPPVDAIPAGARGGGDDAAPEDDGEERPQSTSPPPPPPQICKKLGCGGSVRLTKCKG